MHWQVGSLSLTLRRNPLTLTEIKKKKKSCESKVNYKEQQKGKHETVRRHKNHKMWGRRVRKFRFSLLEFVELT